MVYVLKMATPNSSGYVEIYDDNFCKVLVATIDIPSYEELLNAFHKLQNDMTSLCIRTTELKMKIRSLTKMRSNLLKVKKNDMFWRLKI